MLERARRGDAVAFTCLVRPHLNSIRTFAYSFCSNWAEADDLAQEALLKAYRSIGGFSGRSNIGAWLHAVARSTFLDSRRGRLAHTKALESAWTVDPATDAAGADELIETRHEIEELWNGIRQLDPRFRVPLVLFEIEGMDYESIARVEGVPVGTVRSRIARARGKLLEVLNDGRSTASDHTTPSASVATRGPAPLIRSRSLTP